MVEGQNQAFDTVVPRERVQESETVWQRIEQAHIAEDEVVQVGSSQRSAESQHAIADDERSLAVKDAECVRRTGSSDGL